MNAMTKNIGKLFIALVAAALAFCLTGCSQNSNSDKAGNSDTQAESTNEQAAEEQPLEPIEIGKTYTYKYINGDDYFSVVFEGIDYSESLTDYEKEYGGASKNESIYVALLKVTNISADQDSFIPVEQVVFVKDADGVSLTPSNTGQRYGQYTPMFDNGIYDLPQGETKRYGYSFIGPKGLDKVDVELRNRAEGSVPVE